MDSRAQEVLGDTSDSYLANIASWADEYRATAAGRWSAPLHFIDAEDSPPSNCNVDYERDCGSHGCSISAMANYTRRLVDGELGSVNTAQALKFLVHFTGDLTQPLHDEAYEVGGNRVKVTFDGYQSNLHADWDTHIPEKLIGGNDLSDAKTWAQDLVQQIATGKYQHQAPSWIKGDDIGNVIMTATRWASDANAYVCSVVMPDGAEALQEDDLYPRYYNSVIDTVELQIAKAGFRLGNWLNAICKVHSAKRHGLTNTRSSNVERSASPVVMGRDTSLRPLSKAQLARAAMGGSCCGESRNGHEH